MTESVTEQPHEDPRSRANTSPDPGSHVIAAPSPSGADLDAVLNVFKPASEDFLPDSQRDELHSEPAGEDESMAYLRRQARRAALRRAIGPRLVLLGWSAWLLGSWALVMGFVVSPASATWMMMSAAIGLVIGYPLFRLSQNAPGMDEPGRRTAKAIAEAGGFTLDDAVTDRPPPHPRLSLLMLVDTVSMWAVMQAVIWPLALVGSWGLARASGLNATMLGWALIVAAIVSLGAGASWIGGRTLAMVVAVMVLVAEPVIHAVTGQSAATPISPLMQIQAWTQPSQRLISGPIAWSSVITFVTGVMAWLWSLRIERARARLT